MSHLNQVWHEAHVLGIGTLEARLQWHVEHEKVCQCRHMPHDIMAEARRRGLL